MVAPSTQKNGIATGQAQLVISKDALKNGATVSTRGKCKPTKNHHYNATFGASELVDITKWWNMSGANGKSASGTTLSLDTMTSQLECSKDLC